jgi:hypothetical protein
MRTFKILPLILAVVSITIVAKAQDINTCRPKAEHILTAAQSHKPDGIDELLAPDFRFSNIKQPVAAKVLKQIITQMPPMTGWEQAEIVHDSTGLKICYWHSTAERKPICSERIGSGSIRPWRKASRKANSQATVKDWHL